jgi:hypothetical protein
MGQRIRKCMLVRSGRIVVRELDYGERDPEHVHIATYEHAPWRAERI